MYSPTSVVTLGVVLPLLGAITVVARFIVRLRLKAGSVSCDDWLIACGCLLVCAMGANQVIATVLGGLGGHTPLTPEGSPIIETRTTNTLKSIYAQDIIEKPAYGIIKLSILLFYRRIFITPTFRLVNTVLLVAIAAWSFSFFVSEIFICGTHPETFWSYDSVETKTEGCADGSLLLLMFAITDVVGDIIILAAPVRLVIGLQKGWGEKIALVGIFLLGAMSTVAGIVRLKFVSNAFLDDYGQSGDINHTVTPPFVWTIIEASLGVIAACLPTLAPFLKQMPRLRRSRQSHDQNKPRHHHPGWLRRHHPSRHADTWHSVDYEQRRGADGNGPGWRVVGWGGEAGSYGYASHSSKSLVSKGKGDVSYGSSYGSSAARDDEDAGFAWGDFGRYGREAKGREMVGLKELPYGQRWV